MVDPWGKAIGLLERVRQMGKLLVSLRFKIWWCLELWSRWCGYIIELRVTLDLKPACIEVRAAINAIAVIVAEEVLVHTWLEPIIIALPTSSSRVSTLLVIGIWVIVPIYLSSTLFKGSLDRWFRNSIEVICDVIENKLLSIHEVVCLLVSIIVILSHNCDRTRNWSLAILLLVSIVNILVVNVWLWDLLVVGCRSLLTFLFWGVEILRWTLTFC